MKKLSIFSILLLVALMLTNCKDPENKLFGGGDGSNSKPYLITSVADLTKMSDLINAGTAPYADAGMNYRLTADIVLPTPPAGSVGNLTPIGTNEKKFLGNFDGNNKTISGLIIDNANVSFIGLFGDVEGGSIKNLGLPNVNIKGGLNTGGIVGKMRNGSITGCYVTGTVSGKGVGGIAGDMQGDISNCYSACSVTGSTTLDFTGGIAGYTYPPATIKNCYATGTITGSYSCGGIVGGNNGTVSECLALNLKIIGTYDLGRVVGKNYGTTFKLTRNAGLQTMTVNGSTINTADGASIHGTDISKADATKESTYKNAPYSWAFGTTATAPWKWSIGNYTLPVFYWQTSAPDMPTHLKP